ncbi:MAG TPA: SRPBCC family protein [Thermosynechococcaceae cyanobacterium]
MSNWLEHSVQVEVDAPIDLVWSLWANLEQMPRWMKWIDSVTVPKETPDLSLWKLNTGGMEFTWKSRITKVLQNQIIQWESVDGLPNRGAIRFYDRGAEGSVVRMSVAYAIPGFLGKLLDNLFIGRAVESTLLEDLERFRVYALQVKTNNSEG